MSIALFVKKLLLRMVAAALIGAAAQALLPDGGVSDAAKRTVRLILSAAVLLSAFE